MALAADSLALHPDAMRDPVLLSAIEDCVTKIASVAGAAAGRALAADPRLCSRCLRTLLRLDPWIPYGKTWLSPNLPEGIGYLKVEGIPLAGSRVTIEVGDQVPGGMSVSGLPPEIEIIREPRHPSTAV